jgi:hypothetical protein
VVKVTGAVKVVRGSNGQETFLVEASSGVIIIGNKGAKHYIISPSTSDGVRIVIKDFDDVKGDVLDLSRWSYSTTSLSYYTAPLTFSLQPQNVSLILSSHASYDINSTSILYPSSGSSSTSSSTERSTAALSKVVGMLTSSNILSAVIPLLALTILACVISYRERLTGSKKKGGEEEQNCRRERSFAQLVPSPVPPQSLPLVYVKELLTIGEEEGIIDDSDRDDSDRNESDDDSEEEENLKEKKDIGDINYSYDTDSGNDHEKEEDLISSHNDLSYHSDSDDDDMYDYSSPDLSSSEWSLNEKDFL